MHCWVRWWQQWSRLSLVLDLFVLAIGVAKLAACCNIVILGPSMHIASMLVPQVCPAGRTMAPPLHGMPLRATPFLRGEDPLPHTSKSSAIRRRLPGAPCCMDALLGQPIRMRSR